MSSELGGCQRVLRDDLRLSENTRERERERRMGSGQDQQCSIPGFSGQPWRTSEQERGGSEKVRVSLAKL